MQVIKTTKQQNKSVYLAAALLSLTVISGSILTMNHTSATGTASDTKTSTASVTVPSFCSMTATINTAHSGTVPGGIYSGSSGYYPDGIGKTTIQTLCNDSSGYAIYAVGFTGGSTSGSNTVLHSSELSTDFDIVTGTETSGDTSQWAMKLAKVTDPSQSYLPGNLSIVNGFSNYHAVPSSYTKVANYTSATDAVLGSKLTTTYAAYIAGNQPAGTYVGKVKYTLVHPGNESLPAADNMQNVDLWGGSIAVGEEVTVTDNRDGQSYTVARVCTEYDVSNNDSCNSSQLWMTQNLDLQIGGQYDSDGDGIKDTPIVLTSDNTDLNTAYATDGTTLLTDYSIDSTTGTITWAPGSGTSATVRGNPATISDFSYSASATSVVTGWTNDSYHPYMAEGSINGDSSQEVYEYATGSTYDTVLGSLTACTDAGHTAAECAHYKVGNYYNFSAATAMSDATAYTAQYTVMPNSICPKGWHLPKGLTSNGAETPTITQTDFNKMLSAQGVASATDLSGGVWQGYASGGFNRIQTVGIYGDPLYFVRSGSVGGTTLYRSSYSGYYWSSTVATPGTYGYYLYFNSGGLSPAAQDNRYGGFSVRCVAE